ncbi:MAG: hypothetical protein M0Z90_08120 [Desulfobacteraceae bacterium]|nr:hypothetical protein [Desulfobacteraceae bacterium]
MIAQIWPRCGYDRRRGDNDRRRLYSLDYFAAGGEERRNAHHPCRRGTEERRRNWVRASRHVGVYAG